MSVPAFAERHPKAIMFSVAVLMIAGIAAALNLPISIFPDITFPRIVVLADNGDDPADRVMITLTKPLEEAVNSIPGVRSVRSKTSRGSVEMSINCDWGTDMILTQQLFQARIADIRNQLPPEASIRVERMNASFFPIAGYALTSETRSQVELRDVALYTLRPALSRIHGISQVWVVGGRTRELLVAVDPGKLAAFKMDIRSVSEALQKTNIVSSVGLIDANYHLYLTLVDNMAPSLEAVQNTVIATRGTTPIHLSDVASVTPSEKEEYTRIVSDGKDAVLISILKQPDGNTVQIAEDVAQTIASLRSQIPADVKITNWYDQSDIIKDSFGSVRDSIGLGVIMAVLLLLVFLRNWQVTLVAAVIIPITVAITVLLLYVSGENFNIMTLGGIAAAIGLIIDDTIVIVENVFRHFHDRNAGVNGAIHSAMAEMLPAIIGSSAATIVIHIPFAFLSGVAGAFFKSLSLTMVFALLVSLGLSLLLAPLLASRFIPGSVFEKDEHAKSSGRIIRLYQRMLGGLLKRPVLVLPIIVAILAGGYLTYNQLGSGFMPEMDEGAFVLDYFTPPGTSLTETSRILARVEKMIMATPEVESYSRRTGTEMGFFLTEPNSGDMLIKLKKDRKRSADQIVDELRDKITSAEPALSIDFGEAIQDLIGDLTNVPSPVEVKIYGENRSLIESTAKQVAAVIDSVPGVVDVFSGVVVSGPAYILTVDERAAGRAGLTVDDVREALERDVQGVVATELQRGEKLIGIRVRLPRPYRDNIDALMNIRIYSPNGGTYLLGGLASVRVDPGQSEIQRENLKQTVAVTARIADRDLGSVISDIKKTLATHVLLPQGVTVQYGGAYETQQESFKGLLMVLGAASLFVFIVLVIEFESFFITGSIYLVTILSLFGVFAALFLTDTTLNISSFVGSILILGAVSENGIFLVHYYRKNRLDGLPTREALIEAGSTRMRPIVMTSLAAILTLLPLASGVGAGAQMQQPLAIAVIGGFVMSDILLLFVLPLVLAFKEIKPKTGRLHVALDA